MNPALPMLLTFAASLTTFAAVASIASDLFLRDRARVSRRIDEFRQQQRDRAQRSRLFKDLGQITTEAAGAAPSWRERIETLIGQSGLDLMTVEKLLGITLGAALVAGALGGLIQRNVLVGAVAALGGAALPPAYVVIKRNARLEALRAQLPDAFDLMSRVIRAGQTIEQGLLAVSEEFAPPIGDEFAYCYEQQNLGLPPDLALHDLARRTGLLEVKIFVTALLVQQQTGGNLAELLDKLAGVIRERFRTRGKIKALTAEGRMQGLVLLFLPVLLFFLMLMLNREFTAVLLEYPKLLVGCAISELFGALMIRKIVNFDF